MDIPKIESLTLREKLAQLLIVRQSDLMMYADTAYTSMRDPGEAAELVEKYNYGGIWLHGGVDVNQMNEYYHEHVSFTTDELREWFRIAVKNAKIPVLAANDASGKSMCKDLSSYPSGMTVGAANDDNAAFELANCIAREHAIVGMDWIWTPIADYVNRTGGGITRQYANIPDEIIRCAIGYAKGIQSMNMAATVKHFPGADKNETRDSHVVTTLIRTDKETWLKEQGRIFQEVIDAGVESVMIGAKGFPAVDDTKVNGRYVPAALSYKITTQLLKEEMGFDGVALTDDVTMGGYTSFLQGGKLYAEFIKAGCDMLLGVGVDAVDLLEEEVKCGNLSEERVDDAVRRVFAMKKKLGLFDGYRKPPCSVAEAKELTEKMARNMEEKAATLICDRMGALPFDKEKVKKVAIICYTHNESIMGSLAVMKQEFEAHGAEVLLRRRLESFEEAKEIADNYDLIVYAAYITFHNPKGSPSFYGDEFWALRYAFVYGLEKSVGVSLGYPHIHYNFMEDANVFVNLYSPHPEAQKVFVKGLFGELPFVGKSPVELDS